MFIIGLLREDRRALSQTSPPSGRSPTIEELTWTISTMLFFYICFPALAPRMQRVPLHRLPILVWTMYVLRLGCSAPVGPDRRASGQPQFGA